MYYQSTNSFIPEIQRTKQYLFFQAAKLIQDIEDVLTHLKMH